MDAVKVCNMAFEVVGRTFVLVHNKDYPTDAEWDAYLQALGAHLSIKDRRSLVVTEGGAPSSKQRTRMSAVVGNSLAPTAVVTSSSAVQATVGALHLRNADICAFAPSDLDGALRHLGLREEERQRILTVLPALQHQVGSEPHAG